MNEEIRAEIKEKTKMKEIYSLELHETAVLDTHTEGVDMVVVQRVHGGWIYNYYKQKFDSLDSDKLASSVFVPYSKTDMYEVDMSEEDVMELFLQIKYEAELKAVKELYTKLFGMENKKYVLTEEDVADLMHTLISVKEKALYQ